MITRFEKYNENIKSLLVGPTEKEVWDNFKKLSPDQLLLKSSKIGFIKGVKLALDKGADVHVFEDEPLLAASENGHTDIVKLLLDRGADVHAKNDLSLQWAEHNEHTEVANFLKKYINKNK